MAKLATIEQRVNPWEWMGQRWNMFAPPGRPSEADIDCYRRLLYRSFSGQNGRRRRVMVLGATPEIREMLAADADIDVTIVDITIDMILGMTRLMRLPSDRETWVRADWIDAPLREGCFDAVVSDLVICNMAVERQTAFLDKIATVLRESGHWINRAYSVDSNTHILPLEELFERYAAMPAGKETINNFRSHAGLAHWDPATKILKWSGLLHEMDKFRSGETYCHPNPRVADLLNGVYELFRPFDKKYYLDTKVGTERLFSSRFVIEECIADESVRHLHEKGYYVYDLAKPKS